MLPVISEDIVTQVFDEVFVDMPVWRKKMIHYIKEENPEINSAIIETANITKLDPKAIALGAYISYVLIEKATEENDTIMSNVDK